MKGLATRKAGEIRPGDRARLQCPMSSHRQEGGGAEAPSLARIGSMIAAAALSRSLERPVFLPLGRFQFWLDAATERRSSALAPPGMARPRICGVA